MNRNEFINNILVPTTKEIIDTFERKNVSYGGGEGADTFHNFSESARRCYGKDTVENRLKVLMVLVDKHLVALNNTGVSDPDFQERCVDVAVYMMLAIGIGHKEDEHWSRGIANES
jgi:hypothetical protein